MNVVRIADFQTTQQGVEVRKVADCDNGYTRIANDLLEALLSADLTKHQYKVALAIVRKTYGFNKSFDRISDSQISGMTGIHRTHVCNAKNALIDRHILKHDGRAIGLNKVFSEWKSEADKDCYSVAKTATKYVAETATEGVQKQLHTKDTLKRQKKNPPTPQGETPTSVGHESGENPAVKAKKPSVDYQGVADAYNAALADKLPACKAINEKRKRSIRKLLAELSEPTVEKAASYFRAFAKQARPFHFGENDRGWRADFDFVVRTDTLLKTLEGAL